MKSLPVLQKMTEFIYSALLRINNTDFVCSTIRRYINVYCTRRLARTGDVWARLEFETGKHVCIFAVKCSLLSFLNERSSSNVVLVGPPHSALVLLLRHHLADWLDLLKRRSQRGSQRGRFGIVFFLFLVGGRGGRGRSWKLLRGRAAAVGGGRCGCCSGCSCCSVGGRHRQKMLANTRIHAYSFRNNKI